MITTKRIRENLQGGKNVVHYGSNWTLPNLLTVIRILMVPAFVGAFMLEAYPLSLLFFIAAGLTDGLDGFLARTMGQRSKLGALIDPLADKLLLLSAFICLGLQAWIPLWLLLLVIAREIFIICGFLILHVSGIDVRVRLKATWDSKLNTLAQILLVLTVMSAQLFAVPLLEASSLVLIYLAGGLALFSGGRYLLLGIELLRASKVKKLP